MLKEPNTKKESGIIIPLLLFFESDQVSISSTSGDTTKANDETTNTMMNSVAVFHAEIGWVMKVVTSHFSYHSCLNMNSHVSRESDSKILSAVKNEVCLLHCAWFITILRGRIVPKSQSFISFFHSFWWKLESQSPR